MQSALDVGDSLYEQKACRKPTKPQRLVELRHVLGEGVDDDQTRGNGSGRAYNPLEGIRYEHASKALAAEVLGERELGEENGGDLSGTATPESRDHALAGDFVRGERVVTDDVAALVHPHPGACGVSPRCRGRVVSQPGVEFVFATREGGDVVPVGLQWFGSIRVSHA